jgi:putative ABC transport system permease protein
VERLLMIKLALASLWNRRISAWLTILAIAVSSLLLLGVERVKTQTQHNFANTISGTDLIVGGRTGSTQLLLSSVFHIGNLTSTISWDSYQYLQGLPGVSWAIPLAMGDSVRGFPVVATTADYFAQFRYGQQQALALRTGRLFDGYQETVVGAEVAARLGLTIGDPITVAHGSGGPSFSDHDDHPFIVSGILQRTGTPVDQALYIPLEGLGLVHGEYLEPTATEHAHHSHDHHQHDHDHDQSHSAPPVYTLSAVLLGLQSKPMALRLQRDINTYRTEPMTAIMPGVALQEFWRTMQLFERALFSISVLVVITGLVGMLTTLLASLRERRREMAILRAIGAGPLQIFSLLVSEALLLTAFGLFVGIAGLFGVIWFGGELLQQWFGLSLAATALTGAEWWLIAAILVAALILSLVPAWRAYRLALADGLSVKL